MKQHLIIAALLPALFGCATNGEAPDPAPVPVSSPRDKDPKAFCYANNTAYPEGGDLERQDLQTGKPTDHGRRH